ncbi:hypothetical protein B0T14DRAFT_549139 [Immersiella caudata]|uniref:Uncharacterized protein n=1 Tax=Immersiella caudata TaxID=314043 RepID=A0AA39XC91_9PEZI|nr:hypothetical protein B0T14DRAFT_549139 [Immersiella caudata]
MFRQRGRYLGRKRHVERSEEAFTLHTRQDENGEESEGDEEELEEGPPRGPNENANENATRVAPGRPTRLPLPPGLQRPDDEVLPSEPVQVPGTPTGTPEPPFSSVSSVIETVEPAPTAPVVPPDGPPPPPLPSPPPGIIPIANPSTPAVSSTTTEPSTTTRSTTPTTSRTPTAPNLPIIFPTTFLTSSIRISPSLSSSPIPSSTPTTSDIPVVSSPPPSLGPGPDNDPNAAAQVDPPTATLKPGAKAGIAMGTLAAVAMLASLLFFLWRRHHLRKARDSLTFSTSTSGDHGGTGHSHGAETAEIAQVQRMEARPDARSDEQILNELLASAYAHQNGNAPGAVSSSSATTIADEKAQQVRTVLDRFPAPPVRNSFVPDGDAQGQEQVQGQGQGGMLQVPNAQLRNSIASWLRRHHPLQLNPMAGRGSREGSLKSPGTPGTPRSVGSGSGSGVSGSLGVPSQGVPSPRSQKFVGGEASSVSEEKKGSPNNETSAHLGEEHGLGLGVGTAR